MKQLRILFAVAVWSLATQGALAQNEVWVTSSGATLKAEKKATSGTVVEVAVGTKLKVLAAEDSWYRVATEAGQNGWIYRGKVADSAPEASSGGGLFGSLGGSGIQASSADTSRSIRGLSPETEIYAKETGKAPKYGKALDEVLARAPSAAQVDAFLAAGKIGEYAE
jgi:uncharacterized protein YgiM (DUF1202 family)